MVDVVEKLSTFAKRKGEKNTGTVLESVSVRWCRCDQSLRVRARNHMFVLRPDRSPCVTGTLLEPPVTTPVQVLRDHWFCEISRCFTLTFLMIAIFHISLRVHFRANVRGTHSPRTTSDLGGSVWDSKTQDNDENTLSLPATFDALGRGSA